MLFIGILNYRSNLMGIESRHLSRMINQIKQNVAVCKAMNVLGDEEDDEKILQLLEGIVLDDTILSQEPLEVYVYNSSTKNLTGADEELLEYMYEQLEQDGNVTGWSGTYVYNSFEYNDEVTICIRADVSDTVNMFRETCQIIVLIFLASFIVIVFPLLFLISLLCSKEKTRRVWLYIVTTIWIFSLSISLGLFSASLLGTNATEVEEHIKTSMDDEVYMINWLDSYADAYIGGTDEDRQRVEKQREDMLSRIDEEIVEMVDKAGKKLSGTAMAEEGEEENTEGQQELTENTAAQDIEENTKSQQDLTKNTITQNTEEDRENQDKKQMFWDSIIESFIKVGITADEKYEGASAKDWLLNAILKADEPYYSGIYTVTVNDNIWDDSVPVEQRITITESYQYFASGMADYFFQAIMLTLLSLVLMAEFLNYEKVKIKQKKPDNFREFLSSLRLSKRHDYNTGLKVILTIKSIADALTIAVAMKLLKSCASSVWADGGSMVVSAVVTAAGFISCFGIVFAPSIYRKCKNVMTYFRLGAVICVAGSVVCFLFSDNAGFIAGYLVVAAGDFLMGLVLQFYTMELEDSQSYAAFSYIGMGVKSGSLIGFVLASVLTTFLDYRYMYLISALALAVLFFITIEFSGSVPKNHESIPARTNFLAIIKAKNVIFYCITMLVPFGFAAYFFKYKMPLDIQELGLSATVVSFILFLHDFIKTGIKRTNTGKQFLKKYTNKQLITFYMISASILFVVYYFIHTLAGIFVTALLLAVINARLSGKFHRYLSGLTGNDRNNALGDLTLYQQSRNTGKTIAPVITQGLGLITLPFFMLVGTAAFLIKTRKKRDSG